MLISNVILLNYVIEERKEEEKEEVKEEEEKKEEDILSLDLKTCTDYDCDSQLKPGLGKLCLFWIC